MLPAEADWSGSAIFAYGRYIHASIALPGDKTINLKLKLDIFQGLLNLICCNVIWSASREKIAWNYSAGAAPAQTARSDTFWKTIAYCFIDVLADSVPPDLTERMYKAILTYTIRIWHKDHFRTTRLKCKI